MRRNERLDRGRVNLWQRWTDEGTVPFHRYCKLKPTVPPLFGYGREYPEGQEPPLSLIPPFTRWVVRHTPFIVLLNVVFYAFLVFGDGIVRASTLPVDRLTPRSALLVVLFVVWTVTLWWLIRTVLGVSVTRALEGLVVYGLSIGLTVGLLLSLYIALPGMPVPVEAAVQDAVRSFPFDYLWMYLVGGMLGYDWLLRTENLFAHLDEKQPAIVENGAEYDRFLKDLQADLRSTVHFRSRLPRKLRGLSQTAWVPASIPIAYLFAFIFESPFFIVKWLFPSGEFQLETLAFADLVYNGVLAFFFEILDFFVVVVFFQFLVFVVYFNRLLASRSADGYDITLAYTPNHPDGYAGFSDFGRFAMRVNVLLVVGGVFMVHFLYQGALLYPEIAGESVYVLVAWGVEKLLTLLAYAFGVIIWFYLSFWQIHKAMRRGKERKLEDHATAAEEPDPEILNGPVWPLNSHLLMSNISLDLLPIMSLLPVLRF